MNEAASIISKSKDVARCSRCVLPANYPHIEYDENGVCNVCREYDAKWSGWKKLGTEARALELERIFKLAKKAKRKYDCLVPISGGKDSLYVLYLCKRKWDMNPLAVNFNNGFQTDDAVKNISNALRVLNVDYVSYAPNWNLMKKIYKCFLMKAGEFCTPCNTGIRATIDFIARKENIPLCITGDSPRSDEGSPKEIYTCNNEYFYRCLSRNGIDGIIKRSIYEKMKSPETASTKLRTKIDNKLYDFGFARYMRRPRKISLPYFIEWNEDEMFRILTKELQWNVSSENKEHTDCIMNTVKCYLRFMRWGFGSKTQKAAALARDGQISRDTAINQSKGEDKEPAEFNLMLKMLDLERKDIDAIRTNYHMNYLR
jgi:N-acetyl sugar amidotransferase